MGLSLARNQDLASNPIPRDWRTILASLSEDARDAWEERAAIIQYDGGEPRPTAERRAFECIVAEFGEARLALATRRGPVAMRGVA